jgi:serine phosphatase RsbU (regulator of sigma subunit)
VTDGIDDQPQADGHDLAGLTERALAGNLAKVGDKLAAQNKLFVRDRLALLLDEGSFVEDGLLANNRAEDLPADGVVTGVGRIDGRPVCVMANDPTVKAGSWGARTVEKIVRLTEHALRHELPVFWLVDSAGARITDQVELFPGRRGAGRIFYNEVRLSGRVPQVCCLFGPSAAGGAYIPSFCDVVQVSKNRIAAVIGDVTGRGIDASITAFQAKYLLRVFLRQYRDPAQAVEELNAQMSALSRSDEEFISLFVVVLDTEHHTLRFASAGHPAAWLWHDRDVKPLKATGALVMLDGRSEYHSREIPLEKGDLLLLYTDGLAEVRNGEQMFGEERIAKTLRRDPNVAADVLCKNLLEAARDFASEPMDDDVAILAIRRS